MQNVDGEKSDGLEIISIGTLYKGSSWEKKYWSSSRGKDRYPYPIGYNAVRTHNGIRYKMEICEGAKGPSFVITSTEGESCSGQTPEIAWQRFQKKGGPKVKLGQRKRFSCKIGGAELFGFRNPLIQRLLRELVADLNGAAERNLLSSSFCNKASGLYLETHYSESCVVPALLTHLVKTHTTRKRSRKHNVATVHAVNGREVKRLHTLVQTDDAEISISIEGNHNGNDGEEGSTSSSSDENCKVAKNLEASSILTSFPIKDDSVVESLQGHRPYGPDDPVFTSMAIDPSQQDTMLDRSVVADTEDCDFPNTTKDENREAMLLAESEMIKFFDLCAPDTLDPLQDNVSNPSPECYRECICSSQNVVAAPDTVISKDNANGLHDEEVLGTPCSNGNSEKSFSDSPGEDLTKSMMTLLLPQALPLLKKISGRKRAAVHTYGISLTAPPPYLNLAAMKASDDVIHQPAKVLSPGELEVQMPVNGSPRKDEGEVHSVGTALCKDIQNSEDVVPDSFDDDQCRITFTRLRATSSSSGEVDRAMFADPDNSELLGCVILSDSTSGKIEILKDEVHTVPSYSLKERVLTSNPNLRCKSADGNIILEEFRTDVLMNTDDELLPENLKATPASQPIISEHNQNQTSHVEEISHCGLAILSQANEISGTASSLRCQELLFDSTMVASSSKTTYSQQAVLDDSIKNTQVTSSDNTHTKLVKYHRRRHSSKMKPKSSSVHSDSINHDDCEEQDSLPPHSEETNFERSKIPLHQTNFNGSGNQDSHRLSFTRDIKDGMSSICISEKELDVVKARDAISSVKMQSLPPNIIHSGALSENLPCRSIRVGCIPENRAPKPLIATECGQVNASGDCLNREMSFEDKVKGDGRHQDHVTDNGTTGSNAIRSNTSSFQVQPVVNLAAYNKNTSSFVGLSLSNVEMHQADASLYGRELVQDRGKSFLDNKGRGTDDVPTDLNTYPHVKPVTGTDHGCGNMLSDSELQECLLDTQFFSTKCLLETQFVSTDTLNTGSQGIVELVGSFIQPAPILSVVLSTQENDIHISVLCGLLAGRGRTIFTYKMPIREPRGVFPSFIGYTSIMLPALGKTFSRINAFERSELQFTPDGQYLVFPNNIKAPYCRECSTHCLCSLCTSDCLEENGLKVVHMRLGYVSLVAKLRTDESVCCILVCEPNHLVAVEDSGKVHVWIMNSTWSASVEEFNLPGLDYMYPCVVDLKRIPKYTSLMIGHNGVGDFILWDISKRIILSKFSAPGSSVFEVLPIGLFIWERKGPVTNYCYIEEQIKEILAATEMWFSGSTGDLSLSSSDQEDVAVWLLVSAACDSEVQYNHQASSIDTSPEGSWRLVLLVKNMVIFGSHLDLRASSVAVSEGLGIVGTCDGQVYIWEIFTGVKVADLHNINGGRVSCISADPKSGTLVVACNESQLLVYVIQRPKET